MFLPTGETGDRFQFSHNRFDICCARIPAFTFTSGRTAKLLALMMIQELAIDRLAAPESFLHAVPEADSALAQLPAEIHLFAAIERWKIEQPGVQIFDQAALFLDLFDGLFQPLPDGLAPADLAGDLRVIHPDAAHHSHSAREVFPFLLRPLETGFE